MTPASAPPPVPVARLRGIDKSFRSTVALKGAELTLHAGEVHGVLGENGAGKTTLLNILGGIQQADAGSLHLGDVARAPRSPRDAWQLGVGMVHQHFTLVPRLTVLENLTLGHRGAAKGWRIPLREIREKAETLMDRTGLRVPLDSLVEDLGVGDRQRVEILKALLRDPRILILDEPTAVLTPSEVGQLFDLLQALAAGGTSVVLVAHKLDEVLGVAHRITVMRDGATVLTAEAGEVDADSLTLAMVGREAPAPERPARVDRGAEVAHLDGAGARGGQGEWAFRHMTLGVHRGEILGIAGVEGNGQRELARVLSGRSAPAEGGVSLPAAVGFVSQDRWREGLVAGFDLVENMALALHRRRELVTRGLFRWPEVRRRTEDVIRRYAVRAAGPEARARSLSGGNQQRLVVARELAEAGDLLVAENPTRGLDVAATAFVHREILQLVQAGGADAPGVVLISTDLDEILALSHRIMVMVRGSLIAVPDHGRTREAVGALMLSGTEEEA